MNEDEIDVEVRRRLTTQTSHTYNYVRSSNYEFLQKVLLSGFSEFNRISAQRTIRENNLFKQIILQDLKRLKHFELEQQ